MKKLSLEEIERQRDEAKTRAKKARRDCYKAVVYDSVHFVALTPIPGIKPVCLLDLLIITAVATFFWALTGLLT